MSSATPPLSGYARFAWGVLAYNLFVIVWGAFVRATGSGAGCGSHWPLCNGEVVPRAPEIATLIEFGHRATSGIALLLVVALVVLAWRRFAPGDAVRRAAGWSGFLMLTEALIGAGLVLLEYVADDTRVARGWWVGGHLINTFLLVAALAATAWFASGGRPPLWRRSGTAAPVLAAALVGVLLLGVSGAVTALGDTLFPVATLAEGKAQTFSESAHLFVRLRIWHPTLALAVGALVLAAAWIAVREQPTEPVRRLALGLAGLYAVQLAIGAANVLLLAPVPLQLLHLFLSDLLWIALVLLACAALAEPRSPSTTSQGIR
jgi:heme A synthase